MSCFGCSKKYGLFCKEHGCPNCGYSYCIKCLKRPIAVPKRGGKVENVCVICFDKLSKLQNTEKVVDCEALPGVLVTKAKRSSRSPLPDDGAAAAAAAIFEDEPPDDLPAVLAPVPAAAAATKDEIVENLDSEISKRLKDLKVSANELPSDAEMRARLAELKGVPNKEYSKKELLLSTDQRSDQEKMNALLEQFMGETQLDKRVDQERLDAVSDIERRLRALRDADADGAAALTGRMTTSTDDNVDTPSDNEEDEKTLLKNIMEKYLAEARLPEAGNELEAELNDAAATNGSGATSANTEQLPWCTICNEDAVWRCKSCDGDLFCAQCFRECHDDDEEYKLHVKEPYNAPPHFKENHF